MVSKLGSGPVLPCDGWVLLAPRDDGGSLGSAYKVSVLGSTWLPMCRSLTCDPHEGVMLKYLTSFVSLRKEEFKYLNSTPTNTEVFCDKTPHLTNCAGGNYQVEDNIGAVGSGHLARL